MNENIEFLSQISALTRIKMTLGDILQVLGRTVIWDLIKGGNLTFQISDGKEFYYSRFWSHWLLVKQLDGYSDTCRCFRSAWSWLLLTSQSLFQILEVMAAIPGQDNGPNRENSI